MERQIGDSIQGFVILTQGDNPVLLFRACAPTPTPCIDDTVAISFGRPRVKLFIRGNSSLIFLQAHLDKMKIAATVYILGLLREPLSPGEKNSK